MESCMTDLQTEATTEILTATVPAVPKAMRRPLLALLRPKQWIKNAFVLAPLVFAGLFKDPQMILQALTAMVAFCVASSAIYVMNDMTDVARDREHPTKRHTRPIAAGLVTIGQARALMAALLLTLAVGAIFIPWVMAVIGGYMLLNVAYSFKLKHVPVVDLFCIASGFVLRLVAGAVALQVPLTSWMAITTLCLALYFAAIKRRQEIVHSGSNGRNVLGSYSVALLDRYAEMSALGAVIFYALFTMTVRPALSITIPLVLFGFFRYRYLVEQHDEGESPTDVVWKDLPLALVVLAWVGACMFALWSGIPPR
jgi:4-hydroxybenzoate polyprenyltransferase